MICNSVISHVIQCYKLMAYYTLIPYVNCGIIGGNKG